MFDHFLAAFGGSPPYSPRYPRFHDPWTCNYSLPLWYRVQACKAVAVMSLLRSTTPADIPAAVQREAIRIAGHANNRRAYASVYEEKRVAQAAEKAVVRRRRANAQA